ncbi:MAG: preprotein translocase subunit SecY [Fimbriimonas sp.]
MSLGAGFGQSGDWGGPRGDKGLSLPLLETVKLASADPDLRQRILFILGVFAVFALGVHVPVPIPGLSAEQVFERLRGQAIFGMLDVFGGGALRRISIFSLGLNPYITSSIILQILTQANPVWKKEMQEGGEYARKQQNKRTRLLALALCFVQGFSLLAVMKGDPVIGALTIWYQLVVVLFWTAGAMFMLWLGEQISEKGIGNGLSLMIFAGIVMSLPGQVTQLSNGVTQGIVSIWQVLILVAFFLGATWFIVYFTIAQRRIPIQHMRRNVGTKVVGGQTSYLPLPVAMAGVIPIIFAFALIGIPSQVSLMFGGQNTPVGNFFHEVGLYMYPGERSLVWANVPISKGFVGCLVFTAMIFFFTYFWTAIQFNVEDISNNLKRGGSFIPGIRPGKQTKDFLDGVISKVTIVGAGFISIVALSQFIAPVIARIPPGQSITIIGGTSLLIMVSVALETMRQIEASILMKQYGN